jgi:hypothetical protein
MKKEIFLFNENINVLISLLNNAWHLVVTKICWYVVEHTYALEIHILYSMG